MYFQEFSEMEESYIAINLSASDVTRAEDRVYVEGAEAERAVKTAHFFFFKDGAPFPVNITNGSVTSPGGTINHLSASLSGSTSGMNNVSDIISSCNIKQEGYKKIGMSRLNTANGSDFSISRSTTAQKVERFRKKQTSNQHWLLHFKTNEFQGVV